ncbi:MAG: hypothetical protein M1597_00100 [Candidatus Thermoplasmatota archaeon]|nr:hypothetical protein [Candidatus Thermoplasmatota archaeon]
MNLHLDNNDSSFFYLHNNPFPPGEKVKVLIKAEKSYIFDPENNRVVL